MGNAKQSAAFAACLFAAAVMLFAAAGCRRTPPTAGGSAQPCPSVPVPPCDAVVAAPAWRTVVGRTVILDPGHGGQDEGTSHFGLKEKDINLDLALRTAALLRARGANVVLTRSADVFIPLPERSAIANRNINATFVSIHVNASGANPNAAGVETFVLTKDRTDEERAAALAGKYRADGADPAQAQQALADLAAQSRKRGESLASSLQRSLVARLGETDRGVKPGNLAVLRETYFAAAALVEVGFLTNARSAEQMRTDEWRRRTSEALCEGICEFLQRPE